MHAREQLARAAIRIARSTPTCDIDWTASLLCVSGHVSARVGSDARTFMGATLQFAQNAPRHFSQQKPPPHSRQNPPRSVVPGDDKSGPREHEQLRSDNAKPSAEEPVSRHAGADAIMSTPPPMSLAPVIDRLVGGSSNVNSDKSNKTQDGDDEQRQQQQQHAKQQRREDLVKPRDFAHAHSQSKLKADKIDLERSCTHSPSRFIDISIGRATRSRHAVLVTLLVITSVSVIFVVVAAVGFINAGCYAGR